MNRKGWTKSLGERGARVRLYEKYPGGPIMRSVFINGKEARKSLGHRDKEKAIRQAYELLTALLANENALDEHSLTLGLLADLYLESPAHLSKKARSQHDEGRTLRRVVAWFGPTRRIETLSDSDVRRYTMARRQGLAKSPGAEPRRPVGDRTIGADLELLLRALRWAVRERKTNGERLLKENPLLGIRLPSEKNPRRPVMQHDEYLKVLAVAERVHPLLKVALVVAEGTGRRLSAWRNLFWDDVDFDAGAIRWRAAHDKKGYEQVVPMSEDVKQALLAARRALPTIGNTPVFPAPRNPTRSCGRHLLDNWLRKAYVLAGLTRQQGAMWHSLRRKWATERKGYPIKDVTFAGGWRTERTVL
ncbi:MAG: tyrosine-type recombinase/integrase, partial [bacterium]